jgi:(2R)-sulfolactate sulfo-lyase subunit alpha
MTSGDGAASNAPPTYQWIGHHDGDDVGVAVVDVEPGSAHGMFQDSERTETVTVTEAVPLGHKIALRDLRAGQDVIKYGVRIGTARDDIAVGAHVHVHNIRSARWQTS